MSATSRLATCSGIGGPGHRSLSAHRMPHQMGFAARAGSDHLAEVCRHVFIALLCGAGLSP